MIKKIGIDALKIKNFHYITTITKPQIENLIKTKVIQLGLFDNELCEVIDDGIRYVFRKNPLRAEEIARGREEKKVNIQKLIEKKNTYLAQHPKANAAIAVREIIKKIHRTRLEEWITVQETNRQIQCIENDEALAQISKLDGCYVIKTDVINEIDKEIIHDRYKDLAEVEWAFRTCKTGLLELRPIYTRTEANTRGHALVVMLAYMIIQRLRKAWNEFDLTVEEGIKQLTTISCCEIWINGAPSATQVAMPTDELKKLLDRCDISLPHILPRLGAKIVTRKKLQKERKSL